MNRKILSSWIKAEADKAGSFRRLALSLGTSTTTLNALRDEERGVVNDELLKAIAHRRNASAEVTAKWLGIEPPTDYDWPAKFAAMELRLVAMERKVDVAYQRLTLQDSIDPNLTLDSYLLERGVNVRTAAAQEKVRSYAKKAAPEMPAAFERFLLIAIGVVPARSEDLPVLSAVLKKLTGDPWTPLEVERVLREGR